MFGQGSNDYIENTLILQKSPPLFLDIKQMNKCLFKNCICHDPIGQGFLCKGGANDYLVKKH